jgi:hypothetical protein
VYGPEAGKDRSTFAGLTALWVLGATERQNRGSLALAQIGHLYPKADQGERLKQDLLGGSGEGWVRPLSDEEVILGGLSAEAQNSIPLELFDVDRRVRSILKRQSTALLPIVTGVEVSTAPLADLVLDSLASASMSEIGPWLQAEPAALDTLLKLRPEIAALPAIWKSSDQDRVWRAISKIQGKQRRSKALAAMLASKAELEPAMVLSAWKDSEELLLDQVAAEVPSKAVGERWLHSLPPGSIARWLNASGPKLSPRAQVLIFTAAGPSELAKLRTDLLVQQLEITKSQEFLASVFVASIGCSKKPKWAPIAVSSFDLLLAQRKRYSRQAVTILGQLHCDLSKDTSWPEKMARCLNLAFQDDKWDPIEALHLTPEAFKLVLAADRKAGLARRVSRVGADNPERLTPTQSKALLQNIKERSDPVSLFEWGEALARKLWPF